MHTPALPPSTKTFQRTNLKLTLALAVAFSVTSTAQAQTSLGEVQAQGQASAPAPGKSFFLQAPSGTVTSIPESQRNTIQQFNPQATQAQTEITAGQFESLDPTDSFTRGLENMPNVVVSSDGDSMNGDTVYINGFGQNLINWTLDGIPLNDNDSYAFYTNEFIPTRLIAGTRYFPGAASAAIPGLAAFGGSVETYSLNPSAKPSVSLLGGYGSFGKYNVALWSIPACWVPTVARPPRSGFMPTKPTATAISTTRRAIRSSTCSRA